MSRMALKVMVLVFLMALLSLTAVSTASAAVCPGGPGPTCIELRVNNPPVATNTPTFTDGATVQTWPTPGVPGCLPDVTPNWPGALIAVDSTAPVAPPIQTCYNNGALWARSGRDVGAMAGSQCINDLENVSFNAPAGKLFTSVSIELKCAGPATRLHDVQVYYYIAPGQLCEQQLIEPPLYAAKPHGAPGVNSYILDTVPSDTLCAAGFRRIEIEPQIGSACSVVNVWDFRTASVPDAATQVWPTLDVQGDLPDVAPNGPGALGNGSPVICGAPDEQLSLIKSASPATYSAVGAVISYSYLVTNSGDVTLAGPFTVSDNKATASCPATASLVPGASITCTASYTISQGDLDAGSVTNVASASNGAVTSPTDTETVTAVQNPHLALTKSASPASYNAVGNVINYTLVATNDGNVTLGGVSISDPTVGALSCTPAQPAALAPGASLTCTGSHTVSQADLDTGHLSNTANAAGTGPQAQPVASQPATVTVTAVQTPALSLTKSAVPTIYSYPGQVIVYTYEVKNTGNVTLSGPFSIADDKLGTFQCDTATSLAPNASITCTNSYTIQASDLNNAFITNQATATDMAGTSGVTSNQAQVTINQAATAVVPTLSEWGMIIFAALMAATAFWAIRRRQEI